MGFGFQGADKVMSSRGGPRYPALSLKELDRARFHFLTSGDAEDPLMMAAVFHGVPDGEYTRFVLCLRELTHGAEVCAYCELGNRPESQQFAMWTYTHHILHSFDNPDDQQSSWEQVEVPVVGGAEGAKRRMFKEEVNKPLVLWLKRGRGGGWYNQFRSAYYKFGTLLGRMYQLRRTGKALDTEYTLGIMQEEKLPDKVFKEAVQGLQTIEDLFRQTAGHLPPPAVTAMSEATPNDVEEIPLEEAKPAPGIDVGGAVEELV